MLKYSKTFFNNVAYTGKFNVQRQINFKMNFKNLLSLI